MTSHPTTLSLPSPSLTFLPSLSPCCSAGLGLLRLPTGPVQLVPGCISWLIARHVWSMCLPLQHWFRLNLQWFQTCSLHWRSCQRLFPPSLTLCRWRTQRRECWQNEKTLQTAVMRDMPFWMSSSEMKTIPIALLPFCFNVDLPDSVNRKTIHFPLHLIDSIWGVGSGGWFSESFIWRVASWHAPGFGSLGIGGGSSIIKLESSEAH